MTDADVVLGYINPDYYYGGKLSLNAAKAAQSARDKIAKPLGIDIEEAAAIIRKIVDDNMASAIMKEVHLRGYSPEEFILFAAGGAGDNACGGITRRYAEGCHFSRSHRCSAPSGSSTMEITHVTSPRGNSH